MLQVENEYETQIRSNYYQKNASISNLKEPKKSQKLKIYTPQIIENNSTMNDFLNKNTTNKI